MNLEEFSLLILDPVNLQFNGTFVPIHPVPFCLTCAMNIKMWKVDGKFRSSETTSRMYTLSLVHW